MCYGKKKLKVQGSRFKVQGLPWVKSKGSRF